MSDIWDTLYAAAKQAVNPRRVSADIEVGGVGAAVESESGKIYTGVCVDTACSLGICAERNAIFNMFTCGESKIKRVVAVGWDGKVMPPCGACRELMAEIMQGKCREAEIMLDYETRHVVTLADMCPDWWF